MMMMMELAGIPPLTDHQRSADNDNPRGYYEFERVKKLRQGDKDWLPQAQGKVVKIISALLAYLPPDYSYQVLFMQRSLPEILASQRKMLVNRGEDAEKIKDDEIAQSFQEPPGPGYGLAAQSTEFLNLYRRLQPVVERAKAGSASNQSIPGWKAGRGAHAGRDRPQAIPATEINTQDRNCAN